MAISPAFVPGLLFSIERVLRKERDDPVFFFGATQAVVTQAGPTYSNAAEHDKTYEQLRRQFGEFVRRDNQIVVGLTLLVMGQNRQD